MSRNDNVCVEQTFFGLQDTNLRSTLGSLRRGRGDPTIAISDGGFWRATRTPEGPATQRIRAISHNTFKVTAWGSGAQWLIDRTPVLLGAHDDLARFPDINAEVSHLHRTYMSTRTPCTQAVFEALFPSVLEQKVTGKEARSSYAHLARVFGELAPRPASGGPVLLLPPSPMAVANAPSAVFHQANVELKRSNTIRRAASYAGRLEEAAELGIANARLVLSKLPGIGEWTIAEIAKIALGDSDAVSVGDYHLKNLVSWNLAGKPRGTDQEMLDLLAPFKPFRGRVIQLLQLGGMSPPRFGPRLTIQPRW